MWTTFFLAMLATVFLLYFPGYFGLRAMRLHRQLALALAPLVSLFGYNVLAVVLYKAGIFTDWATLFLPIAVLCVAAFLVRSVGERGKGIAGMGAHGKTSADRGPITLGLGALVGKADWAVLGLYLLVGLIAVSYAFISCLDTPDSIFQEFDNVFHTGTIRNFVKSGCYSVFNSGLYPEGATNPEGVPFYWSSGGSFYPTSWHCLCAMVVTMAGTSIPLTVNAVNATLVGVVFPVGAWSFMKTVFPDDRRVVICGALSCVAFASFPWDYLVFGPLYPNILGNALMFPAMTCFVALFRRGEGVGSLPLRIVLLVVAAISMALGHPNSVFAAVVLLAPFLCGTVSRLMAEKARPERKKVRRVLGYVLCAVAIAAIWVVLYYTPFIQNGPLADWWPSYSGKLEGTIAIVLVAYKYPAQLLLALFVLVGAGVTLYKRRNRWLILAYLLAAIIFLVGIAFDGFLKSLLAGFWYTDSHRTAATLSMAGMPLVALGLAQATRWVQRLLGGLKKPAVQAGIATAFVLVVFTVINFFPSEAGKSGILPTSAFGSVRGGATLENTLSVEHVYSTTEQAFIQKVKDTVGEGTLIINQPNDGSTYAVAADDMNMYYRYLRGYEGTDERPESVLIRQGLSSIATNEQVRDAVKSTGAHYLLLLDAGDYQTLSSPYLFTMSSNTYLWPGIDTVTDDTPGFEVVLSEGDMRLYRITAVD